MCTAHTYMQAVTIHKPQGLSLDNVPVVTDLGQLQDLLFVRTCSLLECSPTSSPLQLPTIILLLFM